MIKLKRAYEPAARNDGLRILVERLWPRGVTKEKARVDLWLRDVAPSPALRKWFGHRPERWKEFQRRYRRELAGAGDVVKLLQLVTRERAVTFVYAAADPAQNSARLLKDYLEHSEL